MTHPIAQLLRHHDPLLLLALCAVSLLGSILFVALLRWRSGIAGYVGAPGFALLSTAVLWEAMRLALANDYPHLRVSVPWGWMVPAQCMALAGAAIAALIQHYGARSARNAMLSGSLLASGQSCMVLTAFAGLVRPFSLAYDLQGVIVVMLLGATFFGFAFWELNARPGRRRIVLPPILSALAILVLTSGTVGAILPFEQWMVASSRPDQVATVPVAIIVATETIAVLVLSLLGSLIDNRAAARDRLEANRLRQLADSTFEGILIHRDGEILDANQSLAALLGVDLATLRSGTLDQFLPLESDQASWSGALDSGVPVETCILGPDNTPLPIEILTRQINYGHGSACVIAFRDVRERHESEARIRFLAHHDTLTGLPNRLCLAEHMNFSLRLADRNQSPLAVLCLDLDGFKLVNDTLGHAAGDQLLVEVTRRLQAVIGETDLIARVGGDEFVVLRTIDAAPDQVVSLATRFIDSLAKPVSIDGQSVSIGTSVGISLYPQDGTDGPTLLKKADVALYRVKETGRGDICLFEAGMDLSLRRRQEMEADLRHALANDEFSLHFQPLFNHAGDVLTFEALIRWVHPVRGNISPVDFIPFAEACGLIIPIGEWVLRTACKEAASWPGSYRVAVNLSPMQLLNSNLVKLLPALLAEYGLHPHRLELEVTENVLIKNTDETLRLLTSLRMLGVRLVLDDFGTGYSSLAYLHRFKFDKLKVDRSFVQRIEHDEGSRAIVRAIISMSRDLHLEVTAEGVETTRQLQMLRDQGCDELQGFLLGRPMPQIQVIPFLTKDDREDDDRELVPNGAAPLALADYAVV